MGVDVIKTSIASSSHILLAGGSTFLLSSGINVSPTTMALRDFQTSRTGANPVVQRKAGTTSADVPVLFDYTGSAPSNPQARVIKAVGGALVQDWTTLSNIVCLAGVGFGLLQGVPQGADYLIQLRDGLQPANGATSSNGAVPWGVGAIVLFMGQSNMVNTLNTGAFTDLIPGTSVAEYTAANDGTTKGTIFDDAGWHLPSNGSNGPDGGSSFSTIGGGIMKAMRIISAALTTKYGAAVPVGVIPWPFNATSISSFVPGGGRWDQLFNGLGTTVGSIGLSSPKNVFAGDFEVVMYHQGEADAGSYTATQYRDALITMYQGFLAYVAPFGRTAANLFFGPAVLGNYDVSQVPQIETIRTAVANFEAYAATNSWPNARIGWTTIDCSTRIADGLGGLHFADSVGGGQHKSFHRMIQSILYFLGCATFSGRGPKLNTVASRTGLVVTLSVVHEGGTALVVPSPGNPPTGFYANTAADFSGTNITPTVALINGNTQIQLTFPGGTTFPLYVKHMGAQIGTDHSCNPDFTNMIYDNVTYPTGTTGTDVESLGLPLLPTQSAITVN